MKKIYILSKRDRNNFLKEKFRFNGHRLDIDRKNVISELYEFLRQFDNTKLLLVSEGSRAYFTFFATSKFRNVTSIIINPVFFNRSGVLVTPPYTRMVQLENSKCKRVVLLSNNNKLTAKSVKILNEWGVPYKVLEGDNVSNKQLREVLSDINVKQNEKNIFTTDSIIEEMLSDSDKKSSESAPSSLEKTLSDLKEKERLLNELIDQRKKSTRTSKTKRPGYGSFGGASYYNI